MYRAREHAFFELGDALMHFDPLKMQFTEMSEDYAEVLRDFERPMASISKESLGYDDAKMEVLTDLLEYGAITDSGPEYEFDHPKVFTPHVTAFRIVMTERCNLQCKECFVTKHAGRLPTMSACVLNSIVDKLIEFSYHASPQIHFFGGEPLLRYNDIARAVVRLETEAKNKPQYSITTNATMMTDEIAKFLAENHFTVAVSIDGDERLHNLLRPDKTGGGSYKAAKDGYDKMVKAGVQPSVIITPHPDHVNELAESLDGIIEDFQPKTITINEPFEYDTLRWSVDGERYANFLVGTLMKCRQHGIKMCSALSPILAALSQEKPRESPCSMMCSDIMASIRTDGKISYCSQKWHDQMVEDAGSYSTPLAIPHRPAPQCKGCVARTICGGPCPAFQMLTQEDIDVNKCIFMQNILQKIVEHLDLFEEAV